MTQVLAVAAGGALGALARYGASLYFGQFKPAGLFAYPLATLLVNVAGCFLLALLVFSADGLSPIWKAGLGTGFLGALTTFSTFELEVLQLGLNASALAALGYLLLSVALGFGATLIGRALALHLA